MLLRHDVQVVQAEKLVSIFEPHTDIIRRGKKDRPVEFGHKVWFDEVDGGIASTFYLGAPRAISAAGAVASGIPDDITDPALLRLYEERSAIEAAIDQLRARRADLSEEEYDLELEDLLVEMALKTQEIRAHGGGGR